MKSRKPSPASVIAVLALFFALGGTALASRYLITSTKQIKPSVLKKLKRSGPRGLAGARGTAGPAGPAGSQGPAGAQGPQGPGAVTLATDLTAASSPTPQTLGTVLGDTIAVSCTLSEPKGGEFVSSVGVLLKTQDGSWTIDYGYTTTEKESESFANHLAFPAPSLSSLVTVDGLSASNEESPKSEREIDFVQLGPAKGRMTWHEEAVSSGSTRTCHFSVQSFPSS